MPIKLVCTCTCITPQPNHPLTHPQHGLSVYTAVSLALWQPPLLTELAYSYSLTYSSATHSSLTLSLPNPSPSHSPTAWIISLHQQCPWPCDSHFSWLNWGPFILAHLVISRSLISHSFLSLTHSPIRGGHWVVAKTAKPQQNVPKTANPCPKLLKTETAMSVKRSRAACKVWVIKLPKNREQHLQTVNCLWKGLTTANRGAVENRKAELQNLKTLKNRGKKGPKLQNHEP